MNTIDFVQTDLDDLSCHQGVTFDVSLLVTQGCTELPDDLGGYTAAMTIYNPVTLSVIKTIAGTITVPSSGIITFTISATDTALLVIGIYEHNIEISLSGTVYRISQGNFEVSA